MTNGTGEAWRGDQYTQLLRRSREPERSMFNVSSYSFDGPITFDGDKSEKLDRDDLLKKGPAEYSTTDGWVGAIPAPLPERYRSRAGATAQSSASKSAITR